MMRRISFVLFASVMVNFLSACSKKSDDTTLQITVADGRTTPVTENAVVNLYESITDVNSGNFRYTSTTDQNNQVKFNVTYLSKYYVVVTKGTAKNYYSRLIPVGTFQSQTDINSSATQTPAGTVGGVKYKDVNGDGVINALDKTDAPTVTLQQGANTTQTITVY